MLPILTSLTDDSIGIIYDHNMFIGQATGVYWSHKSTSHLAYYLQAGQLLTRVKLLMGFYYWKLLASTVNFR